MALIMAAVFSLVCFGFAITGFTSLGELQGDQLDDAKGFAWFWTFLGAVGVVFGAVSVWIVRTQPDE